MAASKVPSWNLKTDLRCVEKKGRSDLQRNTNNYMKLKTSYFNSNDPPHKIDFKKDLQSE